MTDGRTKRAIDVAAWVDQRMGASGFLTGMLYRKVPKGTNWFSTLGSATLFAFIVQAVTGVFLAMFYTPSVTQAYASISHINNDVPLGALVHGMHKWGASVMVILIFLHMGRTFFFFGAYKYPRELNWVIGVVLLILTMFALRNGLSGRTDSFVHLQSAAQLLVDPTSPKALDQLTAHRAFLSHVPPKFVEPQSSSEPSVWSSSARRSLCNKPPPAPFATRGLG